ncbi:PQQ-binding-like beta-propeller repeat protein [Streptomyces sp. NBC_01187]|uniref:outer membrane protein assembly factor BamB family protein n=1 Tax=Streptomyces sp. NBC_01187 TaxID=2903766 RepID=UPI002F90FAF9|nr:PQQ-binding-like beta-propeller repeat protein [Streptomyces sp. NBC_01187]
MAPSYTPLAAQDPAQLGQYRLVGRLGRGGMGQVYLGRSASGRLVAVKVVRAELDHDPGLRRRFVREVAAARRVTGFFTAAVVDADPDGDPAWLATAYVPGLPLSTAVAEHGPWSERAVCALGAALAEALEGIHHAGLVHRDLKPSNVLLAADGPRVIDFGISLAADDTQLTQTGMLIGTPGFISPEQVVGDATTAASDVFALGAVVVWTATGSGPFGRGSAHAVNYRVAHEEPDLAALPEDLAKVVARCVDKEPARRPTAAQLVTELGRLAESADGGPLTEVDWLPPAVMEAIGREGAATPGPPEVRQPVAPTRPIHPTRLGPTDPGDRASPADPGGRSVRPRRRPLASRRGVLVAAGVAVGLAILLALPFVPFPGDSRGSGGSAKSAASGPRAPKLSPVWSFQPDKEVTTAPAHADGRVYVTDDNGTLYAVKADTGAKLWKFRQTGDKTTAGPVVAGDTVYFASDNHYLYALDARSGRTRWEKEYTSSVSSLAVADGRVYAAADEVTGRPVLTARDAHTGRKLWNQEQSVGTLVAEGGTLYYSNGDRLTALRGKDGSTRWKAESDMSTVETFAVADGLVHLGGDSPDSDTSAFAVEAWDAGTGKKVWDATFPHKDSTWAPPARPLATGGLVLWSGHDRVHAFTADTGDEVWRRRIPGSVGVDETSEAGSLQPLGVEGGALHLRGHGGSLYTLGARTGACRWKCAPRRYGRAAAWETVPAALHDGVLYYGDRKLYAGRL